MWRSAKRAEFEQLVHEHLPDVLRLARKLTGCPEIAEEVAQTSLLHASRGWRSFRGDSQFKTWMFRVVINVHRDRLRSTRVEHLPLPSEVIDHRHSDPCAESVEHELGDLIASCISRLPTRQQEVLVLSTYEGLNATEIAATLEITKANVHATLHVARQRMRELLQPYFAESN